jgi:hypothetical protein
MKPEISPEGLQAIVEQAMIDRHLSANRNQAKARVLASFDSALSRLDPTYQPLKGTHEAPEVVN